MAVKIGVVCEGSHDFNVMKEIVSKICTENNIDLSAFDCLQPALSATFDQVGGGGWGRVKSWCEQNGGTGYQVYLDAPLFANSPQFDLILVHLDGDVLDICDEHPLTGLSSVGTDVSGTIEALEGALLTSWMAIEPHHKDRVVACVPVRHLEAWLLAALDPSTANVETTDTKETFRAKFAPHYPKKNKSLYIRSAQDASKKVADMRANCLSFCHFEDKFLAAAT